MAIRVITTSPTGSAYEITDLIDDLSWSNVDPGGDERCTFAFHRSWFDENPEIAKGAKVRVEDGLQRLWSGRIEERSRGGGSTEQIQVTCYGPGRALKDNPMSMVYVDTDFTGWTDLSASAQLTILQAGFAYHGPTVANDDFSGAPALKLVAPQSQTGPYVGALYDIGEHNLIGWIYYKYGSISSAAWTGKVGVQADDSTIPVVPNSTADLITSPLDSGFGVYTPTINARYANCAFANQITTTTGDQVSYLQFVDLLVFGDHGLAVRSSASGGLGFYDSDIVRHVLDQYEIQVRQVDEGTFVIEQAAYKTKVDGETIISDVSNYENRSWGTWGTDNIFDTDDNAQFDYKLKSNATRHWTVERADAENLDLSDEISSLFDTVIVKYQDASGKQQSVTRTDTIPDLQKAGLSPRTLELAGGILTQAGAETLGDIALNLSGGFAPARGSLTMKGNATHCQRGDIPAHFMRADGSNILIRDILPSTTALSLDDSPDRRSTFPIKRVSVDASGKTPQTTVDLDQTHDRLTQLQARLEQTATVTLE